MQVFGKLRACQNVECLSDPGKKAQPVQVKDFVMPATENLSAVKIRHFGQKYPIYARCLQQTVVIKTLPATNFTRPTATTFCIGAVDSNAIFGASLRPFTRMAVINMRIFVICYAVRHGCAAYKHTKQKHQ